jgi:hypothetical protein
MAFDYAKKIQHLIAMAEDETLTAEARANYSAKAEQLMQQYRIAEEDLIATDQFAVVPVMDVMDVMESGALSNPLRGQYWAIFSQIARHTGIRVHGQYRYDIPGQRDTAKLEAKLYGYEGDIAYAKYLWTAARLVFLTRIDARVNPALSDQENAYYMRNSGMKRNEIATALWGSSSTDGAAHGKVQRLYLAECAKRTEVPRVSGRGIQVDIYRKAYADAFVDELGWRLRKSKDAAGVGGGGLELHGRKERVDEAFYAEHPDQRPLSAEEQAARQAENEAYWAKKEQEERDCSKCAKAKGKCNEHRPRYLSAAETARINRKRTAPEARAGARAGEAAASAVNLQRGFSRTEAAAAPASRPEIS